MNKINYIDYKMMPAGYRIVGEEKTPEEREARRKEILEARKLQKRRSEKK